MNTFWAGYSEILPGGWLCKMKIRLTPSSSTEAGIGLSLAIITSCGIESSFL